MKLTDIPFQVKGKPYTTLQASPEETPSLRDRALAELSLEENWRHISDEELIDSLIDSIEHTAEIRGMNKVEDWAMKNYTPANAGEEALVSYDDLIDFIQRQKAQQLIEEVKQ